jgi:uncharacterized membrane protein YfcA
VLTALLPPDLSLGTAALLIGVSFFTSATTAVFGLGGGVMMLAVLASVLPPTVVIPVHGIVQVGSNLGRAVVMRAHIVWALILPFAIGSVVGVALAAALVTDLPAKVLNAVLGLFILYSTWTPKLKPAGVPNWVLAPVGAVSSFATMFLGATGPLVAAFISPDRLERHEVIASHAASMTIQHGFKIAAFNAIGFAFLPWLPMLALMVASGFLGTLVGRRTLDRLPARAFSIIFKTILTLLALDLVRGALR